MNNDLLTQNYAGKIYEPLLTKKMSETCDILEAVNIKPDINNLRQAFSSVKRVTKELILVKQFREIKEKEINPVLNDIELVLFGLPNNTDTLKASNKLKVKVGQDRFGKLQIYNSQNIIKELWEIIETLYNWGDREGLFTTKPTEKNFALAGLKESLLQ